MICGKLYQVDKSKLLKRCQRHSGHDDPAGGYVTDHARKTLVNDHEPGWTDFGSMAVSDCPHGEPFPAECKQCKDAFRAGIDAAVRKPDGR